MATVRDVEAQVANLRNLYELIKRDPSSALSQMAQAQVEGAIVQLETSVASLVEQYVGATPAAPVEAALDAVTAALTPPAAEVEAAPPVEVPAVEAPADPTGLATGPVEEPVAPVTTIDDLPVEVAPIVDTPPAAA